MFHSSKNSISEICYKNSTFISTINEITEREVESSSKKDVNRKEFFSKNNTSHISVFRSRNCEGCKINLKKNSQSFNYSTPTTHTRSSSLVFRSFNISQDSSMLSSVTNSGNHSKIKNRFIFKVKTKASKKESLIQEKLKQDISSNNGLTLGEFKLRQIFSNLTRPDTILISEKKNKKSSNYAVNLRNNMMNIMRNKFFKIQKKKQKILELFIS
jgi:hypothetical protein